MALIKIEYHKCDICGANTKDSSLPKNWTKYKYKTDWRDGAHAGTIDREFTACHKCSDTKRVFRRILHDIQDAITTIRQVIP